LTRLDTDGGFALDTSMSFGRQKNLVRRAVRPDGRFTRDIRRRGNEKASLLDLQGPQPKPLLHRVIAAVARWFGGSKPPTG
jgi:hypothetical protein